MGGGFLWFFIGAGAATMYSNAKRNRNPENDSEWGWGRCHGHFGRDRAAQALNPPPPTTSSNVSELQTPPASLPFAPIPSGSGTSAIADPWTAEKERVRDIGKQVGVNVMEFSESTLDTLLSSIESVKARVVQQRLEREKQEAERKRAMEEYKMNPPKYV